MLCFSRGLCLPRLLCLLDYPTTLLLFTFHALLERGVRSVVGLGKSAGISAETVPLVVAARPPNYRTQHSADADWAALRHDIRASKVVHIPDSLGAVSPVPLGWADVEAL